MEEKEMTREYRTRKEMEENEMTREYSTRKEMKEKVITGNTGQGWI